MLDKQEKSGLNLTVIFYCWIEGWLCNKDTIFDVKQGGCRQTPPTILWFGGSCSSVAVLTTSLKNKAHSSVAGIFRRP